MQEAAQAQAEFEAQQAAMQQAEFEAQQAAAQQAAAQQMQAAAEQQRAAQASVPDWYARAQEKAKKPRNAEKPAQRSRYASALDAAVAESAGHFAKANNIVEHELERSFDIDRDTIREVRAPQWATIAPVQPTVQSENEQPVVNTEPANVSVNAVSAAEQVTRMQQVPMQEEPAVQAPAPQQAVQPAQFNAPVDTVSVADTAVVTPQPDVVAPVAGSAAPAVAAESEHEQVPAQQPGAQFAVTQASEPEPVKTQAVAPAEIADPFATAATPPIDVTKLHLDDVPPMGDVPMPAFLDPRKVQEEAQSRQSNAPRSGNRVDVTQASITEKRSSRCDQRPRGGGCRTRVRARRSNGAGVAGEAACHSGCFRGFCGACHFAGGGSGCFGCPRCGSGEAACPPCRRRVCRQDRSAQPA